MLCWCGKDFSMKMTQKFRRFTAAALLLLFATTSIISILPPSTAEAEDYGWGEGITAYDQAKRWFYYRGLRACLEGGFANEKLDPGISTGDINDGDFDGGLDDKDAFGFVARNLDDLNDHDGTVSCNDGGIWVGTAENFEFDNVLDLICAINRAMPSEHDGLIKPNGTNGDGSGDCEQSTSVKFDNGGGGAWQQALTAALSEEGSGTRPNFNIGDNRDYRALMYVIGRESLLTFCGEKDDERSFEDRLGNDTNDDNRVRVDVVDESTGDIDRNRNYVIYGSRDQDSEVDDVMYLTDSLRNEIGDGGGNDNDGDNLKCYEMARMTEGKYADAYSALVKAHPPADDDTDDQDGGNGESEPSCESEGGPGAWFMCWVIDALDRFISILDRQIQSLLYIDKEVYDNDTIDEAWGTMRNLALLILVPMMMFMVIGTALNFGPFDPYTVKKALPRMFVAVIFIVLSLPVTQFGIQLSNAVGQGLGNIIISASPDDVRYLSDIFEEAGGGSQESLGWITIVAGIGGWAIGAAGALISFGLVTIVGLLIGFCTLVLRQVLLILLVVIAPLAILAWIFPGNDKLWGLWKGTFIAMLLMYPIIAMLLASGKFVAGILG